MERSPAMRLPPRPRLRTTIPKHCPSMRTVRWPVTFSVVTMINDASCSGCRCGSRGEPNMGQCPICPTGRSICEILRALRRAQDSSNAKTRCAKRGKFSCHFNLIWGVQPSGQKYSDLRKTECVHTRAVLHSPEGRTRRHERGAQDAMDADRVAGRARELRTSEIVLSRSPDAGIKLLAGCIAGATVARKPGAPRR